jgi:hypothetical protein
MLQYRVIQAGMSIDRGQFYPIGDGANIHQDTSDGPMRQIHKGEFHRYVEKTKEGIQHIHNVKWSMTPLDLPNVSRLDIYWFDTGIIPDSHLFREYDLRLGASPFFSTRKPGRVVMNIT